jgi:hypothetical protein
VGTPDERGKRTWRFRLSDTETLEVSTPPRATEKQVRRRGRWSLVLGTLLAAVMFIAAASADNLNDTLAAGSVTNPTINEGASFSTTIDYQVAKTGSNNTTFPAMVNFALSGAPAWASLSANIRTFAGYSDVQSVTVSGTAPSGSGGNTYNFSVEPSTSAENLNPNPAKVDMSVTVNAPSIAAPTVTKNAVGSPNHVSGASTYVTSSTQLGFTVSSSAALSACTISIDGPTTNDASFSCVIDSNSYTLGGKLTSPPDGSYLNSASATNAGGTGSNSFTVILDNTAPSISVTGYTDGAVFVKGVDTLPTVGCSTADDGTGSGVASQSGPAVKAGTGLNANGVGSVTYQCTATDNLGNSRTVESTYSVIYNWSGFFSPVENATAWNSAKAGQSIPLKFSLGGDQGLNIFASGYPKISSIACPNGGVTPDPIEEYATITANSKLIYDALAGQYNYVWKTDKAWAGKCFRLDVKLDDNTTHSANFQFTK